MPPEGVDGAAREAGQGAGPAPTTGNRLVDEVLAGLAGVDGLPVAERLVRLTAAQEALAQILDGTGARLPGAGGPA